MTFNATLIFHRDLDRTRRISGNIRLYWAFLINGVRSHGSSRCFAELEENGTQLCLPLVEAELSGGGDACNFLVKILSILLLHKLNILL